MLVKNFSTVITGCTPSTKNQEYWNSNDYMFITSTDLKNARFVYTSKRYVSKMAFNNFKSRFIPKDSIIIDCIGSDMGDVALTSNISLTNQSINAITHISKEFLPLYLYYFFQLKSHICI